MEKQDFEFVDGNQPDTRKPRMMLWVDTSGNHAAIRIRHEGDRRDQQLISIEPLYEGGPLGIRIRDLYPLSAPLLCDAFGIEADQEIMAGKYGWPQVRLANPKMPSADFAMAILDEQKERGARKVLQIALTRLANAEAAYRQAHDIYGDGSSKAGRAWDQMRNAGAHARDLLHAAGVEVDIDGTPPPEPVTHASLQREREMIAAMGKTNAAAKALLDDSDSDIHPGDPGLRGDLEDAIAEQRALIERAEGKSEDADAPIVAAPALKPEKPRSVDSAGIFAINPPDPKFDPKRPVLINGYRYFPVPLSIHDGMLHANDAILDERQRQVEVEGWTHDHDDQYENGELPMAAACYALLAASPNEVALIKNQGLWPWDQEWLKPGDSRRNLEKAGALILAEIERLQREAEREAEKGGEA